MRAPSISRYFLVVAGSFTAGTDGRCRQGNGRVGASVSCVSRGSARGRGGRPIACPGSLMTVSGVSLSTSVSAATTGTVDAGLKRPIVFAIFGSSPFTILAASEAKHGSTVQARQICAQGRMGLVFGPTTQQLSNS